MILYAQARKCLHTPTSGVICVCVSVSHQGSQFGMVSSLVSCAFNLRRLSSSLLIVRLEGGKMALRNNSCARTILFWPHTHTHTQAIRKHTDIHTDTRDTKGPTFLRHTLSSSPLLLYTYTCYLSHRGVEACVALQSWVMEKTWHSRTTLPAQIAINKLGKDQKV